VSNEEAKRVFREQIKEIQDASGEKDYRAFLRWICKTILCVDKELMIDDAISIDGPRDYGIDILHIDEDNQYAYVVQAKFSEDMDHHVSREEMESFANMIGYLEKCPDSANGALKRKSAEFRATKRDNPDMTVIMCFAVTGSLGDQAAELAKSLSSDIKARYDMTPVIQILDLNEMLSRIITPRTPPIKIRFSDQITRTDPDTPKKTVAGYVSARDLIGAVGPHKGSVYRSNPREYMGKTPTNRAIMSTLRDENGRRRFWKLNNGITAICDALADSDKDHEFVITNMKVVNGRQTMHALQESPEHLEEVQVQLTIHETADDSERNMISEATNTQNPIKPIDLITNRKELRDLELQCRGEFSKFYFQRQTQGISAEIDTARNIVTERRILEKSDAARAYCAYSIDPNQAIMPDKAMFAPDDDDSNSRWTVNYYSIFRDRHIRDLVIPHIFMKTLLELRKTWLDKSKDGSSPDEASAYGRRADMFNKKIIRYYLLRFINLSMMDIEEEKRRRIEDKMIEIFGNLNKNEGIPKSLTDVIEQACDNMLLWLEYHQAMSSGKKPDEEPDPYDIMMEMKEKGATVLPLLEGVRRNMMGLDRKDAVRECLHKILESGD